MDFPGGTRKRDTLRGDDNNRHQPIDTGMTISSSTDAVSENPEFIELSLASFRHAAA